MESIPTLFDLGAARATCSWTGWDEADSVSLHVSSPESCGSGWALSEILASTSGRRRVWTHLTKSPNPDGACITDCGGSSSSDLGLDPEVYGCVVWIYRNQFTKRSAFFVHSEHTVNPDCIVGSDSNSCPGVSKVVAPSLILDLWTSAGSLSDDEDVGAWGDDPKSAGLLGLESAVE